MTDPIDWQARKRAWKVERLDPALARAPERQSGFRTLGEIDLEPVYGPWDARDDGRIGLPGEAPFTRGIHPSGYRSRLWTMRMFAGFGAAEDTNRRFKDLLAAGQTGLSISPGRRSVNRASGPSARSIWPRSTARGTRATTIGSRMGGCRG